LVFLRCSSGRIAGRRNCQLFFSQRIQILALTLARLERGFFLMATFCKSTIGILEFCKETVADLLLRIAGCHTAQSSFQFFLCIASLITCKSVFVKVS
jgi:hypothetical protein